MVLLVGIFHRERKMSPRQLAEYNKNKREYEKKFREKEKQYLRIHTEVIMKKGSK